MVREHVVLFALLVTAALACGEPVEDAPAETRRDTLPSGAVHVSNTGEPIWDPGSAWTLEEELRLGTVEGGGPEQFSQIAGILTDAEGRIYVLDYPPQEIRVFDADGGFSHRIGGQGQGPGEMLRAAGMNWGPEGRLWVWDPGNSRYSVFEPDGTYVTDHRRRVLGVIFPWRGEFTPDGRLVDWGIDRPGGLAGRRTVFYPIRVSNDMETLDTLPPLEYEVELAGNGRPRPFGALLTTYQDRGGNIWFGHTRQYTVFRRTLDGDTTLAFSLPAEAAPVTDADKDSVVEAMATLPESFRVPREEIPDERPLLRRIFSDDAGHVFVVPELSDAPTGTVVDVFRDSGEYVGRMEFPSRISHPYPPPRAREDHIYAVVTDELGVEYVSRMRIVRGGSER